MSIDHLSPIRARMLRIGQSGYSRSRAMILRFIIDALRYILS